MKWALIKSNAGRCGMSFSCSFSYHDMIQGSSRCCAGNADRAGSKDSMGKEKVRNV